MYMCNGLSWDLLSLLSTLWFIFRFAERSQISQLLVVVVFEIAERKPQSYLAETGLLLYFVRIASHNAIFPFQKLFLQALPLLDVSTLLYDKVITSYSFHTALGFRSAPTDPSPHITPYFYDAR